MGHSLYIHFPFCLYKCVYCDFNSYAYAKDKIPFKNYIQSLVIELNRRKQLFEASGKFFFPSQSKLDTIFFGGGTPSLMDSDHIEEILNELNHFFKFNKETEITLEANPATLDKEKISNFIDVGINRISLGVQSLDDKYLHRFGRIHSADEARQTLKELANSKISSWNADMIFGFPGQEFEEWQSDLEEIMAYQSNHLSCYAFTVEPDAPYGKMVRHQKALPPEDDIQFKMLEYSHRFLEDNGFKSYEISNFAKSEKDSSRHNLNYWNFNSYLGIGCGAVSMFYDERNQCFYRTSNQKNPRTYQASLNKNEDFFSEETIQDEQARFEFLMMGLRKKEGINEASFEKLFSKHPEYYFKNQISRNIDRGWMDLNPLRLTNEGRVWMNQVLLDFI